MLFKLEINKEDLNKVYKAIDRVSTYADRELGDDLPYWCAREFVEVVRYNIWTEKFASNYPAYSSKYTKWKKTHGTYMNFWMLMGALYESLTTWKADNGYYSGVPAGVMGSKGLSKQPMYVGEYANYNEYGLQGRPKRPMIEPSFNEFVIPSGPISKVVNKSFRKIEDQWH